MLSILGSFGMGFMSKSSCSDVMPCRAALSWGGKPFKLSFCIHSATVEGADVSASSKPYVTVNAGDKQKQTEVGDWSKDDGRWTFREVLTMEVTPDEEACISICCNQQYDLVVAALSLASRCVGEVCVPVASVLPQLQMEDRDIEGMVYVTPNIGFDLLKDGVKTGRAFVSFETKQPPPNVVKAGGLATADAWCAMSK
eukprot:TRINITY_DN22200_c0_g1_i1.p1 TRINITY_DN22200_c0_g1~~TRINITY_DN22200_c0_g1_i1.p1  ORF type:complete len:198 (-),score=39.82 TRINITY_DN22200_c0_g1_i1:114-707(-)